MHFFVFLFCFEDSTCLRLSVYLDWIKDSNVEKCFLDFYPNVSSAYIHVGFITSFRLFEIKSHSCVISMNPPFFISHTLLNIKLLTTTIVSWKVAFFCLVFLFGQMSHVLHTSTVHKFTASLADEGNCILPVQRLTQHKTYINLWKLALRASPQH